jgi:hypothetical protein
MFSEGVRLRASGSLAPCFSNGGDWPAGSGRSFGDGWSGRIVRLLPVYGTDRFCPLARPKGATAGGPLRDSKVPGLE